MPLFRALAVLLVAAGGLAAAAPASPPDIPIGRCVGGGPADLPPEAGEPYEPRRDLSWPKARDAFALLGYSESAGGSRLLDASGRAVSEPEMEWLNMPADMSRVKVPAALWGEFIQKGYRLDESTCLLRDTASYLTRFQYRLEDFYIRRGLEKITLEQLKSRLAGLKPASPLPADLVAKIQAMSDAGSPPPPSIARLLASKTATVGALARSVDAAYLESTRFFDGQTPLSEFVKASLPAVEGVTAAPRSKFPLSSEEERLGGMISGDLQRRFARTPAGAAFLDRFRGKDGKVAFPPILLLKTTQTTTGPGQNGAFYSPESGAVVMNYWEAAASLKKLLPPEELKRNADELSTARGMRLYLESHPAEREKLLGVIDEIFYHELVHAWQDRRSKGSVEFRRGNAPGVNLLSKEHEAYREQCRYDFERGFQDPTVVTGSGYMPICLGMLKDYDEFRDGITRIYMGTFAGNGTMSDVLQIQRQRESMARRLMGDGLYARAVQTLKLAGLAQGDEMLRELADDYAARERTFVASVLPPLRRKVVDELAPRLERTQPYWALLLLTHVPPLTPGAEQARWNTERALEPRLVRPGDDFPLNRRIDAYSAIMPDVYERRIPWSPELGAAYLRDAKAVARELAAQAKAAKDPAQMTQLQKLADSWEKAKAPTFKPETKTPAIGKIR